MKKTALIILGVLLVIIAILVIFFSIPYSPSNSHFMKVANDLIATTGLDEDTFTNEDIATLPSPVKKYFTYCGYIGAPKMSNMKATYHDVDFLFGKDNSVIKIDYTQYNFVKEPIRIAYIDSSMYGIPFEGLDLYTEGKGSMKGILAKLIPLFNQTGATMDKASLVTFLSESLLVPNAALQDYIVWEGIDDLHAKATITYYGITASGIFTFNENGEMISFTTEDREATTTDGVSEKVRWTIVLGEYKDTDGIKKPTTFKAIWNYDNGDLTYFDGKNVAVEFDVTK